MCEAQIALYEALGDRFHLDRATEIAHKLCVALPTAAGCYGRVCEHYNSDWEPDPDKNKVRAVHTRADSHLCRQSS
jgi:mannose/cellobiose epimerase-like protein (N-acyl-D-glucosamine 2-epimerase family)